MGYLKGIRERRVARRLLRDESDSVGENEDILLDGEVHHHWVVYTVPALETLLAVGSLWLAVSSSGGSSVFAVLFLALLGHAGWSALTTFMDVFVITNFRVFRVSGLGPTTYASTPLSRILDITVEQTTLGLLLDYGHFTFESAAQEQGLRDIRFVSRPLDRDRLIQQQQLRLLRKQRRGESRS